MAEPATHFADMVTRISKIDKAEFAGAAVIVPRDGEPIVVLLADPNPKAAQFWSLVVSRVEIGAGEARQAEEAGQTRFGMMR